MNETLNNEIKTNIGKIYSEIENSFININIDKIIKEDKIKTLIESISKEEDYTSKCFNKIQSFISNKSKNDKIVEHLNIVLVGRTGIGKTTLLNAVLKYDEKECLKTEFGKPCTLGEPEYHESKKEPLLRIADSRGIETIDYTIEKLSESINKFIRANLQSGDPDKFVHCIWYCLNGTRFEDIEEKTLEELSEIYALNSIPIVIVYTQALNDEHKENMEKIINEKKKEKQEEKKEDNYDFIPVLAKETKVAGIPIKPFGIEDLKKISIKRAREAVKSSNYENYKLQTYKEVKKQLEVINKKLDEIIENKIKTKINKMSEGKSDEEICDFLNDLLLYLISHCIYYETRTYVSENSESLINQFSEIKNIIDEPLKDLFKTKFDEYIKNKSENICKEIIDKKRNEINELSISQAEIKNKIDAFINEDKSLRQKAWIAVIKKYFVEIFQSYTKTFKEESKKIYDEILKKDDFKDYIIKLVQERFNEIEAKLK